MPVHLLDFRYSLNKDFLKILSQILCCIMMVLTHPFSILFLTHFSNFLIHTEGWVREELFYLLQVNLHIQHTSKYEYRYACFSYNTWYFIHTQHEYHHELLIHSWCNPSQAFPIPRRPSMTVTPYHRFYMYYICIDSSRDWEAPLPPDTTRHPIRSFNAAEDENEESLTRQTTDALTSLSI